MTRIVSLALFALLAAGQVQSQSGQAVKGEYLTTQVAMCIQCHTPRDANGALIESERFLGAPIPLQNPPKGWAIRAPRIARLPGGWEEQDLIRFLQTGKRPDGTFPERPMPPFRMNREDAAAIAAFLKSVRSTKAR